MVGHYPLKVGILVRIQAREPFDSLRSLMACSQEDKKEMSRMFWVKRTGAKSKNYVSLIYE